MLKIKNDDYDQAVIELASEAKARPLDRLKTPKARTRLCPNDIISIGLCSSFGRNSLRKNILVLSNLKMRGCAGLRANEVSLGSILSFVGCSMQGDAGQGDAATGKTDSNAPKKRSGPVEDDVEFVPALGQKATKQSQLQVILFIY